MMDGDAMSVDPVGIAPGIAKQETPEKVVFLRCRNPKCSSVKAVQIEVETPTFVSQRVYRCVECNHTWSLSVGGELPL